METEVKDDLEILLESLSPTVVYSQINKSNRNIKKAIGKLKDDPNKEELIDQLSEEVVILTALILTNSAVKTKFESISDEQCKELLTNRFSL